MSEEQLKAFLEKVKTDTSLQEKLKAAENPDEVVSIAKDYGHNFKTDHISQLNESELEGLAGGLNSQGLFCGPQCGPVSLGTTPTAVPSKSNPTGTCS